jgi:phosphoribosylaminoimidazolecarboxamide formyltransferase/IMP cyclohydrolase
MKRALVSVSDKTGLLEFARGLSARGYELVSTGGTAAALAAGGLPVVNVSAVTGFPELMDGRVKTLHPMIHGGILARRHLAADLEAAAAHGIGLIDVVAVNLYPFVATAARPDVTFEEVVEQIDIGGPSLVRAAAKNFHDVLVVVEPASYGQVLAELDRPGGPSPAFRFDLARRAFAHTAAYDGAIAATLDEVETEGGTLRRRPHAATLARGPDSDLAPERLTISASKARPLRYGENPHQAAAWYVVDAGVGEAEVLQGKELSFTNLLDLDAAARLSLEFDEPAACVIKHTNPCGAAIGDTAAEAYVRAREADPLAAFGGIVGLNRPIDEETARAIVATFIEAVIAPAVADAARPVLATKPNLRVVVAGPLWRGAPGAPAAPGREIRSVLGGFLVQQPDQVVEARARWPSGDLRVVTRRLPTDVEWRALRFAWRVMAHVKSNAVVFADATRTLAIGAGQMSRVDAVKLAVAKASGWRGGAAPVLADSVAASDAFFPFRDGLDECAAAGATAVVQPGGSVKDAEVIAAADEHGLAMVFTGRRHFRH